MQVAFQAERFPEPAFSELQRRVFADVQAESAALAQVLARREAWRSLGDADLLRRYARRRAGPNRLMAQATDGLWHLFGHPSPVLRELRNYGLTLVDQLAPLKRWLVGRALDA